MEQTSYRENWERYWRERKESNENAPWDVPSALGAEVDMRLFAEYFSDLPLADIGCGNGFQTSFLATKYSRVFGIDISEEAVRSASARNPSLSFLTLDLSDKNVALNFVKQYGHVNVYMRGVIQQMKTEDRINFIDSLAILMGSEGVLFLNELSPNAKYFFGKLAVKYQGLPRQLARVLQAGVTSLVGVSLSHLPILFNEKRFRVLDSGDAVISINVPNGNFERVPSFYAVIKAI